MVQTTRISKNKSNLKKVYLTRQSAPKVRYITRNGHSMSSSSLYIAGEVILYDNQVVLYRSNIDVFFYVVGSMEENELILLSMLNAFYDAVSTLLRY